VELILEEVQQQQHLNQKKLEEKNKVSILIRFDVQKWGYVLLGVNDSLEIQ